MLAWVGVYIRALYITTARISECILELYQIHVYIAVVSGLYPNENATCKQTKTIIHILQCKQAFIRF